MSYQQKKRFFAELKHYYWEKPFLYKQCADQVIRRCVPEEEVQGVQNLCHSSPVGGHFGGTRTAAKVLQSGLYWPTLFKDSYAFVKSCDNSQHTEISPRDKKCP